MEQNDKPRKNKDHENNGNGKDATEYLYILEEVVLEFKNSGEPEQELSQVGYIGLLNAVNLYQNQQEFTFQEYARQLIAGEIRHYIREKNRKVKLPDWLTVMMNKLLNQMLVAYYKQHNQFPDIQELSEMLDLSPEILKEALKAREAVLEVSIDQKRRQYDVNEPPDIDRINKALKSIKHE